MWQTLFTDVLKLSWYSVKTMFWGAIWFFALAVLIGYVMRWWPGDRVAPIRAMNYLMPWLLVALIPSLIIARLADQHRLAMVLAIPTLIIGLGYVPLFMPRFNVAMADDTFKVMTYNIRRNNADMDAVARIIHNQKPDILLLQELKAERAPDLFDNLAGLYPDSDLHIAYEPGLLQAVVSRYPVTPLDADADKGNAQAVTIEMPQQTITVWNVHPSSSAGWLRRHRQMRTLLNQDIKPHDSPLILGGDFNTTDQTETYHMLDSYLTDVHRSAGLGFGFTFPAHASVMRSNTEFPPLVRIDYLFVNDHFTVHKTRTLEVSGGSDHFPIVTRLSLNGAE